MKKLIPAAALAVAALGLLASPALASASPVHHHRPDQKPRPAAITSYRCERVAAARDCTVDAVFTGPQGAWTLRLSSPRHEELTHLDWGTTESSALGSGGANRTVFTPYALTGYADEYTDGILPAGKTATGLFTFTVPAGEAVPAVTITAGR
jgi:hypothetical protein